MLDMTVVDEVEKYVGKILVIRHQSVHPDLVDDAMQEARIQAWRDIEAGFDNKLHVLRRSAMAAEKFIHRQGEYFFGHQPKSRDGIRRSDQNAIEKVQVWMAETDGLRETYWPKVRDLAKAIGVSHHVAGNALKAIRRGDIDHMKYYILPNGEKRADFHYYNQHSVETLANNMDQEGGGNRQWTDSPLVTQFNDTFEDDEISNHTVIERLKKLSQSDATALYLYYFEGYTSSEVGAYFGRSQPNLSGKGSKLIVTARKRYQKLLEEEGE